MPRGFGWHCDERQLQHTGQLDAQLRVAVEQVQGEYAPRFHVPVDVEVSWEGGSVRATLPLEGAGAVWIVPGAPADARVRLDPDGWLLHRRVEGG